MVLSTASSAPRVVIVGITGKQGGSVAQSLLESAKPYDIIGLTRDKSQDSAPSWVEQGVEMIEIDLAVCSRAELVVTFSRADTVFVSRLPSGL